MAERCGDVVAVELPCEFDSTIPALRAAIEEHRPEVVVRVGQAGGRAKVTPERVAINILDAPVRDNAGAQPVDEPVVAGGPAAYFTSLPLKAAVAAIRAARVPSSGVVHCRFRWVQPRLPRPDSPACHGLPRPGRRFRARAVRAGPGCRCQAESAGRAVGDGAERAVRRGSVGA